MLESLDVVGRDRAVAGGDVGVDVDVLVEVPPPVVDLLVDRVVDGGVAVVDEVVGDVAAQVLDRGLVAAAVTVVIARRRVEGVARADVGAGAVDGVAAGVVVAAEVGGLAVVDQHQRVAARRPRSGRPGRCRPGPAPGCPANSSRSVLVGEQLLDELEQGEGLGHGDQLHGCGLFGVCRWGPALGTNVRDAGPAGHRGSDRVRRAAPIGGRAVGGLGDRAPLELAPGAGPRVLSCADAESPSPRRRGRCKDRSLLVTS